MQTKAHNDAKITTTIPSSQTLQQINCKLCCNCECRKPQKYTDSRVLIDRNLYEVLPKVFDNFYTKELDGFLPPIRTRHILPCVDGVNDALFQLVSLEDEYNAVKFVHYSKLSKNGRIKLSRSCDLFENIEIGCNPSDIDSVTLVGEISISGGIDLKNCPLVVRNDNRRIAIPFIETPSLKTDKIYIPLKIIKFFPTNYTEFYNKPLLLASERDISLSIEVKFIEGSRAQKFILNGGKITVGLTQMMVCNNLRNQLQQHKCVTSTPHNL